jgi:hypothetical protein
MCCASSSVAGGAGRNASPFSVWCQRSIFPFDSGQCGEMRTCDMPDTRMNSLTRSRMHSTSCSVIDARRSQ